MFEKTLSKQDIEEIKFLAKQGNGRQRLICNLYKLTKEELYLIVNN